MVFWQLAKNRNEQVLIRFVYDCHNSYFSVIASERSPVLDPTDEHTGFTHSVLPS